MSNSGATVTKFGIIEGVSAEIADFVAVAIQNATKELIAQGGPSVVNGVPLYSNTQGKLVSSSPYSMPNTLGVAGEVLTVDAGGNIVYGSGGGSNPFDQDLNTFNDVSFNSVTTANITGPTKVSVAGVDRLDVTATETNLFSQNAGTGPEGSFLRLKNDNTFALGTRFSNNGTIECNLNSMAIVGRGAGSAVVLTDTTITTSLTNGSGRLNREVMTQTGQEFRDGNNAIRLGITNSDGVVINNRYSLPTTTGSDGDILTRTGPSATTWTAPAAAPTYLPTLTVTNLSVGPSALVQNYTLPTRPPAPNQLILSVGSYVMDIPSTLPLQFRVNTISSGILGVGISFPINPTTPISEVLLTINEGIRSFFNGPLVNVVADIIVEYSNFGNRFGFRLLADTPTANFISFSLADNSPSNINNLFGNSLPPDPTPSLVLPAPSFIIFPEPAIGVFITPECVWTDLRGIPVSAIQSDSGAATIQCEDVGVGVSGIISYGDYNLNNGSLNNIGNINALDNCNITTNTTQIVNGLSELNININSLPRITQDAIKTKIECGTSALNLAALSDGLSQDTTTYLAASNIGNTANISAVVLPDSYNVYQNNGSIQRLIVDDTKSALFSKNALSGPAGSLLELNNDNTFTLGCYFANNGIIECRPDSLALYGNSANSSFIMTGSNITTALSNGSGRIDREILNTTSQSFRDPTGTERLKIDSDITINNAYTLPTTAGVDGEVLTRTSGSATTWNRPQIYGLYSQIGVQTVANTVTETTLISPLGIGSLTVPPLFFQNGQSFLYKTGGTFRDSSNGQTIRFRLRNGGVLFDSGILILSNVNTLRGWNIETQFTYYGGNMITNFQFSYTDGNNDSFGFNNQGTNAINNAVSNTLNFTVQWGVANANNTISSNYGTLTKIF